MNINMYTIRDSASEAYSRPFFARAHGEAIRGFEKENQNMKSMMFDNPEHFSLWFIGTFDDNKGELELPESGPVCLAKAVDFTKE